MIMKEVWVGEDALTQYDVWSTNLAANTPRTKIDNLEQVIVSSIALSRGLNHYLSLIVLMAGVFSSPSLHAYIIVSSLFVTLCPCGFYCLFVSVQ